MTLEECTDLLTPLALAMRADLDEPTFIAYGRMLAHVPVELAAAGLEELRATGLRFFPGAPEIQLAAERARRRQLALHPWEPCCDCEETPRWRLVMVAGVKWFDRCPCIARHQAQLASLGLLAPIGLYGHMVSSPSEAEGQGRTARHRRV
jgi:hypothetical protein